MRNQWGQWCPAQKNPIQSRTLTLFMLAWSLSVFQKGVILDVRSEEQTAVNTRPVTIDSVSDNHWAFRFPKRPDLPSSKYTRLARSPIDHFVWARLEAEGLTPAPSADRYTLIRRLSLDLVGLPPSIEDVNAFVNDPDPEAYVKLVDRLLASPQYGERWALWWLDVARYADSNGYESDRTRSIWPWRDWVVRTLNDDMPFDQFVIEQIAGDMLPDASVSQRIATGFHRNTWINEEGGHDWEQFRYESVVDRIHTTATAFLGMTVACAQCHDHKYDPVTQREYWQLFAFLNNADEPDLWVPDNAIKQHQNKIDKKVSQLVSDRAAQFPPFEVDTVWKVGRPVYTGSAAGSKLTIEKDLSLVASGESPSKDTYTVVVDLPIRKIEFVRLEVLPGNNNEEGLIGRAENGDFVITDFSIRLTSRDNQSPQKDALNSWTARTLVSATENRQKFALQHHVISEAIDDNPLSGWAGARGSSDFRIPREVSFTIAEPLSFESGTRIEFRIEQNMGRQLTMRRFRLSAGVSDKNKINLSEPGSRKQHLESRFRTWLEAPPQQPIDWKLLNPVNSISSGNATMTELKDHSILVTGDRPEVDTYEIVYETKLSRVTGFRLEAIPDERLPNYGPGRGSYNGDGAFVVTEFRAAIESNSESEGFVQKQNVEFGHAYANYHQSGHVIEHAIDQNKQTGWFIGGAAGKQHVAVFEAKHPYEISVGSRFHITVLQNFVHQQALGRFRLFATGDDGPLHSDPRPTEIDKLLNERERSRTEDARIILRKYFLSIAPELTQYNARIKNLLDSRPRFATTFVFEERQKQHQRPTHVHVRGEYSRPDEVVLPAVPAVLHPLPAEAPRNRLTFAKWLVDDRNPLIGRVVANQIWQSFFGRGIVGTPENFGIQGEPPSHPKLLDWLAVELHNSGWSIKSLQRQIVMSAVYRQSSQISPELHKRDPQNILLARGARFRVNAETIRDMLLETSDLMIRTIGGPSVFPSQPEEAGETFGPFKWKDSVGNDRYRRGLYTFRKRGGPYAAFATFDAPPPNICIMSRRRSNTPLQALAQLNDLVVIESSRALARRVLDEVSGNLASRLNHVYRTVLTRPPSKSELTALIEFHQRQYRRCKEGSLDAAAIYGVSTKDQVDNLPSLAAMTTVARLLFNLDETLTKE